MKQKDITQQMDAQIEVMNFLTHADMDFINKLLEEFNSYPVLKDRIETYLKVREMVKKQKEEYYGVK